MGYKQISDYGVIGDKYSAALVGIDGSIDWACFPRFDSPSAFAAILDDAKGGRFRIEPVEKYESNQSYLPNTNVVCTRFTTANGTVELVDFMPIGNSDGTKGVPHEVHRQVRCVAGTMKLACLFQPRFDYARVDTALREVPGGVLATGGEESMVLSTGVPLTAHADHAVGSFTLGDGESATFILGYQKQDAEALDGPSSARALVSTCAYWQEVSRRVQYHGPWEDRVVRSVLLLHLLMYNTSGATVAAPTMSLPERIGGERNWDYRYSWLRDSAFTWEILSRVGDRSETRHFFTWLYHQCGVTGDRTSTVYGIHPDSDLTELTLDHLEGYMGSGPVRVGNGAAGMHQLDVYGEVIIAIATYLNRTDQIDPETWAIVEHFARIVCRDWHLRDQGVWEVRGAPHHVVYSKVMCWAALDRAAKLSRSFNLGDPKEADEWERTAAVIKAEVLEKGWSKSKQAFSQYYGTDELDAANLVIPLVGFLPGDDPRVLSTIRQIRMELAQGPLVHRYHTSTGVDGLSGGEGAFTMLSFWLIGALVYAGEVDEATSLFEEILGYSNHLGLLSEMVDPASGRALGNFPQAFSHVGLIHTARNLALAMASQGAEQKSA
ncbi:MAG: glycoside hydrolase family 15 protein [Dehalococcoidia bacterium]